MKKFEVRSLLAFLLAAMMVFTLAACGDGNDTLPPDSGVTEPAETEPTETDPAETDPPATEPAETDPPATEPVETDPPATEPVETDPPATEPAETDPPVTEPSVCEHKFGEGKKLNATCQQEGGTQYTCKKCGETKVENPTPKVDHLYTTMYTSYPSCTDSGSTVDVCSFCGQTTNEQTVDAIGHDYVTEIVASASFTHHSAEVTACKNCSTVASSTPLEAHEFELAERVSDQETDAGVVTYGFELYRCDCGYVKRVNANHKDGHYYHLDMTTGKYACDCGSVLVGDMSSADNGNKNAGPDIFGQN